MLSYLLLITQWTEDGAAGPNGVRAQKAVEDTENVRGFGNVTAPLQRMEEEIA